MTATVEPFVHPAFLYQGAEDYLAGTVPFILEGLAAGEPVAVAVPAPNLALIKANLGDRASSVELIDMTEAGRNPGRIIPTVFLAFADAHPGPVRLIGEPVWPGRSGLEYPACAQHEALINLAFAGREATMLCPFDVDGLDSSALIDALRTHPVLLHATGSQDSGVYAPKDVVATYNQPFPPPTSPATIEFDLTGLSTARHFVAYHAANAGLNPEQVEDLTLAASELCANSILHGHGHGTLHLWSEDGYVVCEVSDHGRITDLLAGRRPAAVGQVGGRGLLLVNQVADLVRMHHSPGGTTVRAYVRV
jgi:anti-sigma regulatory factor (Ser/Thr protein kinase)